MVVEKTLMRLEISSASPEQTRRLGERLGEMVQAGDLICLQGELGTGKTCFVQGLGQGLDLSDDVHSPTFILANEHRGGRLPLYHLDVYRVRNAAEAIGFGLDDYVSGDAVLVIEWAERIREALPAEWLWIKFDHRGENARAIVIEAYGARYVELLNAMARRVNDETISPAPLDEGDREIIDAARH